MNLQFITQELKNPHIGIGFAYCFKIQYWYRYRFKFWYRYISRKYILFEIGSIIQGESVPLFKQGESLSQLNLTKMI